MHSQHHPQCVNGLSISIVRSVNPQWFDRMSQTGFLATLDHTEEARELYFGGLKPRTLREFIALDLKAFLYLKALFRVESRAND
jgi:hypothetical protein